MNDSRGLIEGHHAIIGHYKLNHKVLYIILSLLLVGFAGFIDNYLVRNTRAFQTS